MIFFVCVYELTEERGNHEKDFSTHRAREKKKCKASANFIRALRKWYSMRVHALEDRGRARGVC